MAGMKWSAPAPAVSLLTATAKTALQILSGDNRPARVDGFGLSFNGTDPTATPVLVELVIQTTAGSGGSVLALKRWDRRQPTSLAFVTTALYNITTEPTEDEVVWRSYVHPQGGYAELEPWDNGLWLSEAERLGVRFTAPAAVSVLVNLRGEE